MPQVQLNNNNGHSGATAGVGEPASEQKPNKPKSPSSKGLSGTQEVHLGKISHDTTDYTNTGITSGSTSRN